VIEAHHLMERAGKFVEPRGPITVRDHRLGNGQHGAVEVAGGSCLSVAVSAGHSETPGSSLVRSLAALAGESVIPCPVFLRGAGGH